MPAASSRVSQACNQCRTKKRRCDGTKPCCRLCVRLGIDCSYADFDGRSRRSTGGASRHWLDQRPTPNGDARFDANHKSPQSVSERERHAAVEATSGMVSADLVTTHLGTSTRQLQSRKTKLAPWNLGFGFKFAKCAAPPLRDSIDWSEFVRLATIYFADAHGMFGAFSEQTFWKRAELAWKRAADDDSKECYEALLSSVAAIGSLFSRGSPAESHISECCIRHLNYHLARDQVPSHDVDGLLLRTLYIRMTLGPQACYLSCCTLMGIMQSRLMSLGGVEESGEYGGGSGGDAGEEQPDSEQTRGLSARLLTAWTANEFGRPRPFDFVPTPPVDFGKAPRNWPAWQLFELFEMSEALNPSKFSDRQIFEEILPSLYNFKCSNDVVHLSRTNLAIVAFRRLRSISAHVSDEQARVLIHIGDAGLEASQRLAQRYHPWHHVANVPFQVVCLYLLLDTRESLARIGQAIRVIKLVAGIFETPAMQTTLQIACHLVMLAQKRKREDAQDLSTVVAEIEASDMPDAAPAADPQQVDMMDVGTTSAPSAFAADFSRWEEIDWNQVFTDEDTLWAT